MLNQSRLGPFLTFIGVFGGGIFWLIACGLRFDYLVNEVYNDPNPGEAIWAMDPVFTILAAVPGLVLFLIGFMIAISPIIGNQSEDASSKAIHLGSRKRIQLNLLYIGEIFLLVTSIAGLIAFIGASTSAITIILVPTIIFAFITATCVLNLLNFLYYVWRGHFESTRITWVIRTTIMFLVLEFVALAIVVLTFQLYTWSFIRSTTIFLLLSGCFGMLFLFPSASATKNKDGAEGEI